MRSIITDSKFQLVRAANVWSGDEGWELLFYYSLYRIGLAIVLIILASPDFTSATVDFETWILVFVIAGFTGISIVAFACIKRRWPAIHILAHVLFSLDILFISFLHLTHILHQSNIVVFYITTVAAAAVMFRTKTALGYACIAILFIYLQETLDLIHLDQAFTNYTFAALSAAGLFAIVLVISRIAKHTRVVKEVLREQELELADLDDINQIVIDNLDVGILFLEDDLSIKLINDPAREMIGEYIDGAQITDRLAELINVYIKLPSGKHFTFRHKNRVLDLSSAPMRNGSLIKIEDRTTISRRIQDSKLTSVGRFASAISHEIRNPLNAINHAAQLLQPDGANEDNAELVGMIRKHVKRIDNIIQSILLRSKPGSVQRQEITLQHWLVEYIDTFKQSTGHEEVAITCSGEPITILFDPTQLEQILTNICQNSLKYARSDDRDLEISMRTLHEEDGTPCLEISNNGDPIPDEMVDHLFEPFYTTDSRSTGLGLYLSREFCLLNGSDIQYYSDRQSHGFRICFGLEETADVPG